MLSVKFLHVTGRSLEASVSPQETTSDMKKRVFDLWTNTMPPLETPLQLRFVYAGRVLKDNETLSELVSEGTTSITIHMLVGEAPAPLPEPGSVVHLRSNRTGRNLKVTGPEGVVHGGGGFGRSSAWVLRQGVVPGSVRFQSAGDGARWLRVRKSDGQLNGWGRGGTWCHFRLHAVNDGHAYQLENLITGGKLGADEATGTVEEFTVLKASPKPSWGAMPEDDSAVEYAEELVHFHGCVFDEDEISQIQSVFDRKAVAGKINIQEVWKFMRAYWSYMQRIHDPPKHVGEPFPKLRFKEIKLQLVGKVMDLDWNQFLQFWFLFDNETPHERCAHGERSRVEAAAKELHKNLRPEEDFADQIFDSVFAEVDHQGQGTLTCKEVELLYYMYSARLCITPVSS